MERDAKQLGQLTNGLFVTGFTDCRKSAPPDGRDTWGDEFGQGDGNRAYDLTLSQKNTINSKTTNFYFY